MSYDIKAIKGSLIIYSEDGHFEQINTTDVYALIRNPTSLNFNYKPKSLEG